MGGAIGNELEQIASQGGQGNLALEDAEELTSFDPSATGVAFPGEAFLADDQTISVDPDSLQSFLTVNQVTSDWASRSGGNVSVLSTPQNSVEGENLNPLAAVSEAEFLTGEGGQYVRESGVLQDTGLGSTPSWLVRPEQVGSTDTTLVGTSVALNGYVGIAEDTDGSARTLIVHIAKAALEDELVFLAGLHHAPVFPDDAEGARESFPMNSYSPGEDLSGEHLLLTPEGLQAAADDIAAVSEQLSRNG